MSLDIDLLKSSFENVKPIAGQVADKFYELLWGNYQGSDALFANANMENQKKLLIKSLVFIVDNLENGDRLKAFLLAMGKRHIDYGAQEEHYDWVGDSLLKTFAHFFGDSWTPELNTQWTTAYQFVANTMIEGAKGVEKAPQAKTGGNVVPMSKTESVPQNKSEGTTVAQSESNEYGIELSAQIKEKIRLKVRNAITQAITKEIDLAIKEELEKINDGSVDDEIIEHALHKKAV